MHEYDKCSKYMIQHHGGSILRLSDVDDIVIWKALQAEPVQIRQLPDGVLEVCGPDQAEADIFILEIATFPDARVLSQAARDAAIIYLQKKIVPELLVLYLHEKGHVPASDSVELRSRRGLTKWNLSWKVVKLWEVPAEDLIATGDVGLLPWVPLAKFEGSPEQIVSRCRAHIDHAIASAEPEKRDQYQNLLAVTQFLLPLRYDKGSVLLDRLRALLGGRKAMIESPLYQEVVAESKREGATEALHKAILKLLVSRFGDSANDLKVELDAVDYDRLEGLFEQALSGYDLASFREQLLS